jgi:uncharacterized protein (DUF736 family)
MQYDNNMSGALFKNDKGDNDKRPDYKGTCEINGVEYRISAWLRTKKDGSGKFMSLKFEAKDQEAAKPAAKPVAAGFDDGADDIPF